MSSSTAIVLWCLVGSVVIGACVVGVVVFYLSRRNNNRQIANSLKSVEEEREGGWENRL
ncbi:MAG: hypothetical protein IT324_17685 [Anaerolineae bacterium]|nr:hypothetical protein [Anaerolineae bacterium]